MNWFDTVKEAIDSLEQRGYTYDFNSDNDKIYQAHKSNNYAPDEFKIVEVYRFEGASNPSESAIVYAIESGRYNVKGYLVNAYGMYADSGFSDIVAHMQIVHNQLV